MYLKLLKYIEVTPTATDDKNKEKKNKPHPIIRTHQIFQTFPARELSLFTAILNCFLLKELY